MSIERKAVVLCHLLNARNFVASPAEARSWPEQKVADEFVDTSLTNRWCLYPTSKASELGEIYLAGSQTCCLGYMST